MRTEVIPISVTGWNASAPLDMMQPTDAVKLVNYIPDERSLNFRGGLTKLTSKLALDAAVETLAAHRDEDGAETLVCGHSTKISKLELDGTITELGTGYTNARWQTVNFNNLLLMVNGADTPQQYDGTTLQDYVATISGATATDLKGVTVFKGRCYYWENNAAKFWYAGVGAYGGALTSFALDLTTKKGGYVVECCSWTRDSGDGVDDLFVVLMSTGETLVYQGDDPSSKFSLIGSFNLGEPVGVRGSTQFASDRIIITKDGFVNLSTALQVGRVSEKNNVSTKIIDAAKRATRKWGSNYGWEIFYHDNQSLLIVNVPRQISSTAANSKYEQYCMNTNTGAWTRFTGWNGITFVEVGGELYMGCGDGHVRKCFSGSDDDGVAITYVWTPAFTSCQMPNRLKQATFVTLQTNFTNKDNIGVAGIADFDPRDYGNAQVPDIADGDAGEWDVSDWDEAYWSGTSIQSNIVRKYDIPIIASGYTLSFKTKIQSDVQTAAIYAARLKYKAMRTI